MKFETAIFDLDGTLCDTTLDIGTAVNHGLEIMGLTRPNPRDYDNFVGNGTDKMIERALGDNFLPRRVLQVKEYYKEYYATHFDVFTTAYDGMPECIKALKEKGFKLAVVTNKIDFISAAVVEKYYGKGLFDIIIGQKPGAPLKPDPAVTLQVMKDLSANPQTTAFIGDSDVDIKTGINAGVTPIGVSWGYRDKECQTQAGAEIFADSPKRLFEILTK
ncbi:MAG: HAD family hydrolase [Oscillospiraceae bacterium]|nr:HAD family hydrolase [Candidatus Equicaccousia limihippi]